MNDSFAWVSGLTIYPGGPKRARQEHITERHGEADDAARSYDSWREPRKHGGAG